MAPQDERTWAMLAHLTGVIGLALLGPLLVMLILGPRSRFVRTHAVEALNFHLSLLIAWLVGSLVGIVAAIATAGIALILLIPLAILVAILSLVWSIMACVDAWHGRPYRYPISIRMVS